jgi:hypothetical protein
VAKLDLLCSPSVITGEPVCSKGNGVSQRGFFSSMELLFGHTTCGVSGDRRKELFRARDASNWFGL